MLVTILTKIKLNYNFAKSYKQRKSTMIVLFQKAQTEKQWVGPAFIFSDFENIKRKYSYKKYKNSELLNNNGFYVGLHNKVKESQIRDLAKEINKL